MSIIDDSQPASFRGVPFLVRKNSGEGGRKTTTHEFPGADQRLVEDLGKFPDKFFMEFFVHGDDVLSKCNALRSALNQAGPGLLKHPIYGNVDASVEGTYTFDNEDRKAGVIDFRATFAVTATEIFPTLKVSTPSSLSAVLPVTLSTASQRISTRWVAPRTLSTFTDGKSKILNFVREATSLAKLELEDVSSVFSIASRIESEINALISAPGDLGNIMQDFFLAINDATGTGVGLFNTFSGLFDFGAHDDPIPGLPFYSSVDRQERLSNRDVFDTSMAAMSLASAYLSQADIDYETTEDIQQANELMEEQYRELVTDLRAAERNYETSTAAGLVLTPDPIIDLVSQVNELRALAGELLEQESANAYLVEEVGLWRSSARAGAYRLYGNTDNASKLVSLNVDQKPDWFIGDIRALVDQ